MNELRQLAGGVIASGFDGTSLTDELKEQFQRLGLAGVVLFARNVESLEQTRRLTDALRDQFETPPILAIDQEGGRVMRIRSGVEEIPSMMAVCATGEVGNARAAGAQLAHDLRRAGLNMDFAPVLDLALQSRNTVIGTRAFSSNVQEVVEYGRALSAGLSQGGITPTFKHFPGHGSTDVDSHLALPQIDTDERTFRTSDLAPFAALLPSAAAVMTAHIVVRSIDPNAPATLSRRLLTDVLRSEIGFEGVCFTDCMQMDAIAKGVGSVQGAVGAIGAGADCVLISHSFALAGAVADALVAAVQDGSLPRARLEQAHSRVMKLRAAFQSPLPLDAPSPHRGIAQTVGLAAITAIRGSFWRRAQRACVLSFESATNEGVVGYHAEHASLERDHPVGEQAILALQPDDAAVARACELAKKYGENLVVLMRRANIYESQRRAVQALLGIAPDCVLVSTREPFDVECFPQARNVLASYGDDSPNMRGLAKVIFEGEPARGRLPVPLQTAIAH